MDNTSPLADMALKLSEVDPALLAEEITGKDFYSPETRETALVAQIAKRKMMEAFLSEIGDTHSGISWKEFLEILEKYGFETLVSRQFDYHGHNRVDHPTFLVAAHKEKKLLLRATSYILAGEETINSGTVYGAIKRLGEEITKEHHKALFGTSHGPLNRNPTDFNLDIREGMFSQLARLEEVFEFVDWHDPDCFLWLLDYVQDNNRNGKSWEDYKEEFLSQAPQWVKDFIL